jgi:DNA-binding NtrC family response regulator
MQRRWPGNVRELQNLVRRVVMFSEAESIGVDELQVLDNMQRKPAEPYSASGNYLGDGPIAEYKVVKEEAVQRFTNEYIQRLLRETEGNVSKGATISGLSRTALQKIMRKFGINADDFRARHDS